MPSHFSTIGFDVPSQEAMIALAERSARRAMPFEAPGYGYYLAFEAGGGAALWVQADEDRQLIGMTPHYAGEARMRVRLTAAVDRETDTALDGAWHGWAEPPDDASAGDGAYPFVFDSPDFRLRPTAPLPRVEVVQIAAFAHELSVHRSPQAHAEAQRPDGLKLADESFIPSGLFETEGPPPATAVLAGIVLKVARRSNEWGGTFWWMLVRTLGGEIDVVADPALVPEPPVVGGVVSGSFWLSGRIVTS